LGVNVEDVISCVAQEAARLEPQQSVTNRCRRRGGTRMNDLRPGEFVLSTDIPYQDQLEVGWMLFLGVCAGPPEETVITVLPVTKSLLGAN